MSQLGSDDDHPGGPLSYAYQFAEILEWIDVQIFSPHEAVLEATVIPRSFPGQESPGYHIQRLVTYRSPHSVRPAPLADLAGRCSTECYMIWGKEVEDIARVCLTGISALKKFGDADVRQMLLAYALVAVRYRVLQHKQLFPKAKLRTFGNAFCDETIPEAHRQRFFQKKATVSREISADPFHLDAHILLILFDMAAAEEHPIKDALHYLTNS